jgi:hypothetical protein
LIFGRNAAIKKQNYNKGVAFGCKNVACVPVQMQQYMRE